MATSNSSDDLYICISSRTEQSHVLADLFPDTAQGVQGIESVDARSRNKSSLVSLGEIRGVYCSFPRHSSYLLKNQSENKKLSV